jgi:hypothetical protein
MTEPFEPRNELERDLVAAQEGQLSEEKLVERLLAAQVFMPVRDDVNRAGIQLTTKATPLRILREDGGEAVVLFTSPERAKPFLENHPGYRGGLLTDFRWVVERIGKTGLILNPGWPVGLEMDPEMVEAFAHG